MKMHFDGEALRYLDNLTLRMQKAEAEVERLQAENAKLRKVAEAAREFISSTGCNSKECKKCDPKYIGFCMWSGIGQSLAELDKESSHD